MLDSSSILQSLRSNDINNDQFSNLRVVVPKLQKCDYFLCLQLIKVYYPLYFVIALF